MRLAAKRAQCLICDTLARLPIGSQMVVGQADSGCRPRLHNTLVLPQAQACFRKRGHMYRQDMDGCCVCSVRRPHSTRSGIRRDIQSS